MLRRNNMECHTPAAAFLSSHFSSIRRFVSLFVAAALRRLPESRGTVKFAGR